MNSCRCSGYYSKKVESNSGIFLRYQKRLFRSLDKLLGSYLFSLMCDSKLSPYDFTNITLRCAEFSITGKISGFRLIFCSGALSRSHELIASLNWSHDQLWTLNLRFGKQGNRYPLKYKKLYFTNVSNNLKTVRGQASYSFLKILRFNSQP